MTAGRRWRIRAYANAMPFGIETSEQMTNYDRSADALSGQVLPTMIPDDEEPIVLDEIIDAALSREDHRMLSERGLTVMDILAGNVPEFDPVDIIIGVWDTHLLDEHLDEYNRAMGQLPDLLAEYATP
jgi:hypothetical protein